MLKDLGFVAVDLAEFCGQWWLWVQIWWCRDGFVGLFWIWVLLLWIWLSFVANGGCGLRYGGAVVGCFVAEVVVVVG